LKGKGHSKVEAGNAIDLRAKVDCPHKERVVEGLAKNALTFTVSASGILLRNYFHAI
jgi:hypothetical protein